MKCLMRGGGPRRSISRVGSFWRYYQKSRVMPRRREDKLQQARERISRIRAAFNAMEYLCSGTLLRRTKVCGKPSCRCAHDPSARHGPYYEWGHLKGGKLVH